TLTFEVMRRHFAVLCFLVAALPSGAQDFQHQVRHLMEAKYQSVSARAEELARARRFGEGYELWLSAVPNSEKTAADYFLLGNVFFEALPDKALELHRRASELQPDNVDIQLELAMALHRNQKFREAVPLYQSYINSPLAKSRGPGVFSALLADCLVRLG